MTLAQEITLALYNATLIPMTFFSVLFLTLCALYLFVYRKEKQKAYATPSTLPFITVQIPSFNDPIAARCVERCLSFSYPKGKYEIIIADDSTNPQTQEILRGLARKHPQHVKYVHRKHRLGFKPGALKNAMRHSRGEIIVVFDADWLPKRDFLKTIVRPFSDPNVAIVQTTQGFYNHRKNLVTRFAAYTLMIYHTIVMPLNSRANTVFFCGTAGALRRSAFVKAGGWNIHSITEDSDLTVRLLLHGYKTVYLRYETPSEVPETIEGFVKQQMRWCYGNVRVFMDHAKSILWRSRLTLRQRAMITYVTMGNLIAPVVVLMTLFGFAGWFVGDPAPMRAEDAMMLAERFALTAGFLAMGIITLYRARRMRELRYLLVSSFTVGLLLAVANSVAVAKALLRRDLGWFCTPKNDNTKIVEE